MSAPNSKLLLTMAQRGSGAVTLPKAQQRQTLSPLRAPKLPAAPKAPQPPRQAPTLAAVATSKLPILPPTPVRPPAPAVLPTLTPYDDLIENMAR